MLRKTALVLCERSGIWSAALHRRGYSVLQVDLTLGRPRHVADHWTQAGCDLRIFSHDHPDVVCAFPPCTSLTAAAAHRWHTQDVYPALELLTAAAAIAAGAQLAGLVENPQGLASRILGRPSLQVHPWQYAVTPGDRRMKRTNLWLFNWPPPLQVWTHDANAPRMLTWAAFSGPGRRERSWPDMAAAFVATLPPGAA